MFNTRYARGVMITIPATGAVLENTFEPVADPYRSDYGIGSDELLPSTLPPLERASTTRFRDPFQHADRWGALK